MLQTTVRPNKENFDMQVSLPADYVGKEVHVLFYVDEEVKQTTASIISSENKHVFLDVISPSQVEHNTVMARSRTEKLLQLKKATIDPLFLADIQEVEADFKIADQENI